MATKQKTDEKDTKKLKEFFFPEYDITVKAESLEEATKIVIKHNNK